MKLRFVLALCVYGYTAGVLVTCGLMWWLGDRWWLPTLVLFGPRWVFGLPLVVLIPLAIGVRRRWLWPLGLAAIVVLWPLMGLNLPWRTLGDSSDTDLCVVSCNVGQGLADEAKFLEMLDTLKPDLVALQEYPVWRRWRIPKPWHVRRAGEMLVVSAHPIVDKAVWYHRSERKHGYPDVHALYCVVKTPAGKVGFASIHLETPRFGLSAVLNRETLLDLDETETADSQLEYRRQESEDMVKWLARFPETKILAGDFNMPVESTIYRRYWSGYRNAFNWAGIGYGYSKQTSIRQQVYGTRIDHILTDDQWHAVRCYLGPDLGSDHLPMVADLKRESVETRDADKTTKVRSQMSKE